MKDIILLLTFVTLLTLSQGMMTAKMLRKRAIHRQFSTRPLTAPTLTTSCNTLDFSAKYNYSGLVASGYLSVGKGNSALAFTFYGKKDVKTKSELRNYPTVLWLNGGPGSSSQLGNLQELGPLQIIRHFDISIVENNYTWVKNYNVLFVDQPVGTGLSYADTSSGSPYVTSLDEVATDFYRALEELYGAKGCFGSGYFNIPASGPLVIFGESYGGKYAPAIAKKIVEMKENGGFLTGLRGVAIGDGFTHPYDTLAEVGTYAYHLSLIDFQERSKLEKVLLNASRHQFRSEWDLLHDDFDRALDYIVTQSGDTNVYDIRVDGDYEDLVGPYFRDEKIGAGVYGFNPEVIFDSQAEDVYNHLYTDFMKTEINRVEFLLNKGMPVLIYNGQMDLIVTTPGTMRWVDKLFFAQAQEFREKLFSPWKLNDKMVGTIKAAGNLEFRVVFNAGHLVPMDQPEVSLDMASSFINRVTA